MLALTWNTISKSITWVFLVEMYPNLPTIYYFLHLFSAIKEKKIESWLIPCRSLKKNCTKMAYLGEHISIRRRLSISKQFFGYAITNKCTFFSWLLFNFFMVKASARICRPVPYFCCFLMVWQNLKKKNLKKFEYSVKCPVKLLFDWLDFVDLTVCRTELKLLLPL